MGILLGLHGSLVRARFCVVPVQSVRREEWNGRTGYASQESSKFGAIPPCELGSSQPLPADAVQYFNRWANHELSAKLDADFYKNTEKKMEAMQSTGNLSWIEVQFAKQAVDTVIRARITLKWSYCMAF